MRIDSAERRATKRPDLCGTQARGDNTSAVVWLGRGELAAQRSRARDGGHAHAPRSVEASAPSFRVAPRRSGVAGAMPAAPWRRGERARAPRKGAGSTQGGVTTPAPPVMKVGVAIKMGTRCGQGQGQLRDRSERAAACSNDGSNHASADACMSHRRPGCPQTPASADAGGVWDDAHTLGYP